MVFTVSASGERLGAPHWGIFYVQVCSLEKLISLCQLLGSQACDSGEAA